MKQILFFVPIILFDLMNILVSFDKYEFSLNKNNEFYSLLFVSSFSFLFLFFPHSLSLSFSLLSFFLRDLYQNSLSGDIPTQIGQLKQLVDLYFIYFFSLFLIFLVFFSVFFVIIAFFLNFFNSIKRILFVKFNLEFIPLKIKI